MKRFILILALICTLAIPARAFAEKHLPRNRATILTVGPFVDFGDGVTPETAMTVTNITCELFKDSDAGGVGVTPTRTALSLTASGGSNDMVHITDDVAGFYSLEITAAQIATAGRYTLSFTDADVMCPLVLDLCVEPNNVYEAFYAGTATYTNQTGDTYALANGASGFATIKGVVDDANDATDALANATYGLAAIKAVVDDANDAARDAKTASELWNSSAKARTLLTGGNTAVSTLTVADVNTASISVAWTLGTTVAAGTHTPSTFILSAGPTADNWFGERLFAAVVVDADNSMPAMAMIVGYIGSTKTVRLDRPLPFTPTENDLVYVMPHSDGRKPDWKR